jgi:hypothetical protein
MTDVTEEATILFRRDRLVSLVVILPVCNYRITVCRDTRGASGSGAVPARRA